METVTDVKQKHNFFSLVRHACTMIGRTRRSYTMLSVTIVLSFSLLLGYLGWTDSSLYNRYKGVFRQDRHLVYAIDRTGDRSLIELMKKKAAEYGEVHTLEVMLASELQFAVGSLETEDGSPIAYSPPVSVYCIPRHSWMLFDFNYIMEVTWIDGKEHPDIDLAPGEILMDEQLFYALGLDKKGERPEYICDLEMQYITDAFDDNRLRGKFTVVGTIPNEEPITLETNEESGNVYMSGRPKLVFSMSDMNPGVCPALYWTSYIAFYAENPESVGQLVRSMSTNGFYETYEEHNDALSEMRTKNGTKAAIAAVMLLLLGINLYSSFSNALNDRKFEIGVKRAVGAPGHKIVRQFLYESLFVMGANILCSVSVVLTAGLAYKVIYEHTPNEYGQYFTFTLYISPYSVAMFAACSISLTVVFSLIFAYKSTQVEIVDYLKAE